MHSSRRPNRLLQSWLPAALVGMSLFATLAHANELKLALANSTCEVVKQAGELYRQTNPVNITYICKSSGLLAKGLHGKALDADLFLSADKSWMDFAIEKDLVSPRQVVSPWGNAMEIAAPRLNAPSVRSLSDLVSDKVTTILIGDPSNAPFGRFAKQMLENAGLWNALKGKIQTRKNMELLAESLASASPGTVGILFTTHIDGNLRSLMVIDRRLHAPADYYIAPLKQAQNAAGAEDFMKFLQTPAVRELFKAARFELN